MKALILRADAKASVKTAQALIDKGFQILSVDKQAVAHALIRVDTIDLLVMDERIEGQLTHAIALSGERRNPCQSAILLSDRTADETDDLFDLIPSLYGLVGVNALPELLGELAECAVSITETKVVQPDQYDAVLPLEKAVQPSPLEPLILAQRAMLPPVDDGESGAPCYADVAIAVPAMAEITAAKNTFVFHREEDEAPDRHVDTQDKPILEKVEDVVGAEVAALFRKHPQPQHIQPPQGFTAEAS